MQLRLSPLAEGDLEAIHYFGTVLFGPRQADEYLLGLLEEFDKICAFPLAAAERRIVEPPVRLWRFRAHNVLYDASDHEVVILRILHRSANWRDHL